MKEINSNILKDCLQFRLHNTYKLVTMEDGHFFHIHKILGIMAMIHYCYRFIQWARVGTMGFNDS